MKYPAAIPVILLLGCIGCGNQNHERIVFLPTQIVVSKPVFATQRFIPTNSSDVAFDTKTGSLCRTWDWSDPDGVPYRKGLGTQTQTCDRLYQYDAENDMRRTAAIQQANERQGQHIQ